MCTPSIKLHFQCTCSSGIHADIHVISDVGGAGLEAPGSGRVHCPVIKVGFIWNNHTSPLS